MLREKGSVDGRPKGGDGGNTVGSLCYWKLAVLTVFILLHYLFSSLLSYSTGSEERQRNPKKKERRESGREEGKWELRELIILFNHILDEGQVVCGTESETEKGE